MYCMCLCVLCRYIDIDGQSTRIPKPEWFGHWGIPLQSQPFGGHSLSWGRYNLPLAICGRWCWFMLAVLGHTDNNLYIYLAEWLVFSPSTFILYNHYFEALAAKCLHTCMDVSENRGTPKSSILIGFSIINHPFWGTPIFGNTHICIIVDIYIDVYNIHMRSISTYLNICMHFNFPNSPFLHLRPSTAALPGWFFSQLRSSRHALTCGMAVRDNWRSS